MSIDVLEHPNNKAARIFRLDDYPSVLHPDSGITSFSHMHEANAKNAPAIAAIFTRHYGKIEKIEIRAIGGTNGERKTDLICVTMKNAEAWKAVTPDDIRQQLEERLLDDGTIIITPDMRSAFEINADDINKSIRMYRPETVVQHNTAKADDAITVAKDGWDPKSNTLTCVLGEACGVGACGEANKAATKLTLTSHLQARYQGIRVRFTDFKM